MSHFPSIRRVLSIALVAAALACGNGAPSFSTASTPATMDTAGSAAGAPAAESGGSAPGAPVAMLNAGVGGNPSQAGASAIPPAPVVGSAGTAAPAGAAGTSGMAAAEPGVASDGCAKFDSTYAAIQKAVFENHGCSMDSCHGNAQKGGLDLRAGAAYASLFQVKSQGSSLVRVQPSAPHESYLYLKLAAATRPGSVQIANSPMPLGLPALNEGELEAVRLWILGGAPQTGSVGDSSMFGSTDAIAHNLNACLPKADPIMVVPLERPQPNEGIQFRSPQWELEGGGEREFCIATYYDLTNVIPAEFKSPDGTKFYTNSSRLRQDPGSHHYVIANPGIDSSYATDPAFGKWTCSGERVGEACNPLEAAACGAEGVCGAEAGDTLGCFGYGPFVFGAKDLLSDGLIENVQAANQYLPPRDGVYRELPIKGFLYHDLHGFNLTTESAKLQTRLNVTFAKDRRRRLAQVIDYNNVQLPAGTAPFTVKTVCADHVAPMGAEMVRLTTHMHKRGKRFWVTDPNGMMIYENLTYSDPLYKEYDPGIVFDSTASSARTLKACATYNNGVDASGAPDPATVTRYSKLPDRTQCAPVACVSGKVAAPCKGVDDNASCDSKPGAGDGSCDACPITGGPTTEDEMFVIMPWYILPEGS